MPGKRGQHYFSLRAMVREIQSVKCLRVPMAYIVGAIIIIIAPFIIKYKNWAWNTFNSGSMENHVTSYETVVLSSLAHLNLGVK